MRILLLCEGDAETHDSWSGASRSVLENLRDLGHEVWTGDVDLYGPRRWMGAALTFSPNRKLWASRFHFSRVPFDLRSRNAAGYIAAYRDRIDLILQFGATFEPAGHENIPYMLYCDSHIGWTQRGQQIVPTDIDPLSQRELQEIWKREARVYHDATHIFTMSACMGSSFQDDFGIAEDRITAVHAGPNCDIDRIPARAPRRRDNPPTVLFIGRQFERKGGRILLRAFQRVRAEIPDAELHIIGPTELSNLPPGVTCLGFINKDAPGGWDRISQAYEAADVFCLPTLFEPFGIVFVEAMHFGLPCVGPDAWAAPEIILDGETGYTVDPGSEEAYADRLVELLRDPSLARRMGEASRIRARDRFTWPAIARRMTEVMSQQLPGSVTHG